MSIQSFLNPESQKQVTGELCDEEIVAMVNHDRAKEATIGDQNLGMILVVDSDQDEGGIPTRKMVMSNHETLTVIEWMIQKLLEDEDIDKSALNAVEPLRMLEQTLRVQRLW